jgi:hypothetical protein
MRGRVTPPNPPRIVYTKTYTNAIDAPFWGHLFVSGELLESRRVISSPWEKWFRLRGIFL